MKLNNWKKIIVIILVIIGGLSIILLQSSAKTTQEEQKQKEQITNQYQEITTKIEDNSTEVKETAIEAYQDSFDNPDIIGKLSIENTNLNLPIVQSNDNDYYLNHLLDKSKNSLGSVYLDYRNKTTDRKLIIYGHNSENVYTEFNMLENYINLSYYKNHSIINFETENANYQYKIFSVYIATDDYQHVNLNYSTEDYAKHLTWLKNESLYDTDVEVNTYDNIIVLQTCYYNPQDSYLIVVGKKVAVG